MHKKYLLVLSFIFLAFSFFILPQKVLAVDLSVVGNQDPYATNGMTPGQMAASCCDLRVRVKNNDLVTSPTSTARLKIDGTLVSDKPVPALAPSTSTITVPEVIGWTNAWVDGQTLGNHTFQICVDPNNSLVESDESNNCYTKIISITGVDLVTSNLSYSILPITGDPNNKNLQIQADVRNIGTAPSTPTSLLFSLDTNGDGMFDVAWSQPFNSLSVNESTTVYLFYSVSNPGINLPNSYFTASTRIAACADHGGQIAENLELNNCPSINAPYIPPPPPGNFNMVGNLQRGCQGPNPAMYLDWSDSANATVYHVFRRRIGDASDIFITDVTAPNSDYWDFTTTAGQNYYYYAIAQNSAGQTVSSNTTNINTPYSTALYCPFLSVSCSASPSSAITGQNVTWTAVPAGGSGGYTYSWSGSDSLSGATQSVNKSYATTGIKSGSVTVTDSVFSSVVSACTNSVTISSAPQPDLIVPNIPSVNTGTLNTGNSITFKGNIQNIGNAVAGGTFSNHFAIDLNSNSFTTNDVDLSPDPTLTALAINASQQVTSASWTAVIGTHTLRLCADQPSPVVNESNESNNCNNDGATVDFTFTVTPPPPTCSFGSSLLASFTTGQTTTFNYTGSGATSWSWTNNPSATPGFNSVFAQSPTWSANTANIYTIGLTTTNAAGSTACSSVITVNNPILPDLITQNLSISNPSPTAGQAITFSGNVGNQGAGNAGASSARFCIDNANCLNDTTGRVGAGDSAVGALTTGTSSPTITSSSWTAVVGSHTIYFCADVGGAVNESNEGNNCSNLAPFTVNPAPTPPTCSFSSSLGASFTTGQTTTFTYTGSGATSWSWTNNPSATPGFSSVFSSAPTWSANTANSYTIGLTATNAAGSSLCQATITVSSVGGLFDYDPSIPTGITAVQGGSGSTYVFVNILQGTAEAVTMNVISGLPTGATAVFIPSPTCTPTCAATTLRIDTTNATPVGSYPNITVRFTVADGTPALKDRTFSLTISSNAASTSWIQTIGGDIHTNGKINAPGGP